MVSPARWLVVATLFCGALFAGRSALASGGQLRLIVIDANTGKPVPCRMHLKSATGKPRLQKTVPFWHDHFVFPGQIKLRLPRGQYSFEIERGPEYAVASGYFVIDDHADDEKSVELKRAVDMAAEGWWSADLNVRRPLRDIQLLMQAEDLHLAAVIPSDTKRAPKSNAPGGSPLVFDDDRAFCFESYADQRAGNELIYTARKGTVMPPEGAAKLTPLALLNSIKRDDVWLDVARPFDWDLPVLLALGVVDSIELANDHMCRDRVAADEGDARPRDVRRLPPPLGGALWSQQIYYQVLNCGLRVPPTAGSGSGAAPNPVGYNRFYVYLGDTLDLDAWWQALRAGQVMVTNGPLIRANVRGQLPGYVFTAPAGQTVELGVSLSLSTRDPIRYLEIVKNGEIERSVPIDQWNGTLAPLVFKESGWFLIRAVADLENTYRFASTGPYYVEIGEPARRISRASARFFLDWVEQRSQRLESSKGATADDRGLYEQAIRFWQKRVDQANAP
jgi:hypothetical protein